VTFKLVWENLKHRPLRSLLSFLLIAVPVTLILTLVGLTNGMIQDFQHRQKASGADIVVRPTNASAALNFGSANLSQGFVQFLAMQPHVKTAVGVLNHSTDLFLTIAGIDLPQFTAMSGPFQYVAGGPFRDRDDMIVDRYYADQQHLRVGDPVMLLNHTWHIRGIIEGGQLSHIFVELPILQELDSATGKVSEIFLKLDNPAETNAVVEELKRKMPENPIYSMEVFTSLLSINSIPALRAFTLVVVAIGVVIGAIVVWMSMYMAVLMRTREIGILKSLGGSNRFILSIVVLEALLLGLGGTVLGIGMSFGAQWLIHAFAPASYQMAIVPLWWPIALFIMLASAALGALYPGLTAARHDAIEALAYE